MPSTPNRLLKASLVFILLGGTLAPAVGAGAGSLAEDLEALMPHYEAIRLQLVVDSVEEVVSPAKVLRGQLEDFQVDLVSGATGLSSGELEEFERLTAEAIEATGSLEAAVDIEAAREAFYALTKPLVRWLQAAGASPTVAYCSMKKRSWLQLEGEKIGNPYYGQAMASCGEIVDG